MPSSVIAAVAAPAGTRPAARADTPARTVLALGCAGSLGEELLSLLLASSDYRQVVVGVTQPMGSATARFAPWCIGSGLPVVDEAWIALSDATVAAPASPIRRYGAQEVLDAARLARSCGARKLVVVSPLAALLQMGAGASTLASSDEVALVELGFEQLVVVRPVAADVADAGGRLPARLVRAAARALADIMLPAYARVLSSKSAARAILEAVRAAPPRGTTVVGARDLLRIVQDRLPALAPKKTRLR